MAVSPYTVSVPCPQCGKPKLVGCYDRKMAARSKCRSCSDKAQCKHGEARTRLYRIWGSMRVRSGVLKCSDERKRKKYAHVTICSEWAASFAPFRDWAFANGYAEHLTIDRIEGSKGYEPGNCRWADITTQNRNRRGLRLSEQDAKAIRSLVAGGMKQIEVARRYNVGSGIISRIVAGKIWRVDGQSEHPTLALDSAVRTS